jgi:hypothetical protein
MIIEKRKEKLFPDFFEFAVNKLSKFNTRPKNKDIEI